MDKVMKKFCCVMIFAACIRLTADPIEYCQKSEFQFFNAYASTVINPSQWNEASQATILFGAKPIYSEGSSFRKELYLVKFTFHSKKDGELTLKGEIKQVDAPNPEKSSRECWKTALYFVYNLNDHNAYPEIYTSDFVHVPMLNDNLVFKSCSVLSREKLPPSQNEIVSGITSEGDEYRFLMTYARPESLLKAYEGQRTKNAKTVFFETIGLKN